MKRLLSLRGRTCIIGGGARVAAVTGLILIGMCIIMGFITPVFFTERSIVNLLRLIAPVLLVGIGQAYVLLTGHVDLSIGSAVAMSSMISAELIKLGIEPWAAVLLTVICAAAFGAVNGWLVAVCRLPSCLVTLATMAIASGIAKLLVSGYCFDSIGTGEGVIAFRHFFYYGKLWGIYTPVWIAAALWLVFHLILRKSRFGRNIYAVGSNRDAARLSGVHTVATVIGAYVVSAFCACVVGLVTTAMNGMGFADAGTMYEMYALAAAVLGGISVFGGRGALPGVVLGAALWEVLLIGLSYMNAPVAARNMVLGVLITAGSLFGIWTEQKCDCMPREDTSIV